MGYGAGSQDGELPMSEHPYVYGEDGEEWGYWYPTEEEEGE